MDSGKINININLADNQIIEVAINSTRANYAKLWRGLEVSQADKLIPALYSICKNSHKLALQGALNLPTDTALINQLHKNAQKERLQEHLWRLLINWQATFSTTNLKPLFETIYKLLNQSDLDISAKYKICQENLYKNYFGNGKVGGEIVVEEIKNLNNLTSLNSFIKAHNNEFNHLLTKLVAFNNIIEDKTTNKIKLLPPPQIVFSHLQSLKKTVFINNFPLSPHILKQKFITSALDYFPENKFLLGLAKINFPLSVVLAKTLDVINILENLPNTFIQSSTNVNNIYYANAQTSRGQLFHCGLVENKKIINYAIIAPTEWNCQHENLELILKGINILKYPNYKKFVSGVLLALDPCVEYNINYLGE